MKCLHEIFHDKTIWKVMSPYQILEKKLTCNNLCGLPWWEIFSWTRLLEQLKSHWSCTTKLEMGMSISKGFQIKRKSPIPKSYLYSRILANYWSNGRQSVRQFIRPSCIGVVLNFQKSGKDQVPVKRFVEAFPDVIENIFHIPIIVRGTQHYPLVGKMV